MSSTERAPEPTMEEILASIRRIISEDDQKPAAAAAPQNHQDDEGLEAAEGEADDRIINDIARVLSGSGGNASAPEAPVEASMDEEEDILDLTAELGGLEPVEEAMEADVVEMVEVVAEAVPVEAAMDETLEVVQPAPALQVHAEPMPAPEPPAPVAPPPPMSASDEAASALERAIAALRAGQLPTSFSEFSATPAPVFQTQPPEPVTAPEPQASEPEPEPEMVVAEVEAELVIEEFEFTEPEAVEAAEGERQQAPAWEADAPSFAAAVAHETEREAPRGNGHHDYAAPRTLEDSVKDLLRPMLRQWLDENMARVLTSALKDELKDNPARFEQD
jgi:uncharacterized protein